MIQDSYVIETKVRGLKILLVDSDYDFLQVLTQFLNKEGFEVITAHDGEEGLNKALVESPDLVILEPMLSKVHGFTLCAMITGEFKKNIPVIIISQHYDDENSKKEALRTHGASAYMVRPITKSELRTVIDDVLKAVVQEPDENKASESKVPDLVSDAAKEAAQKQTQEEVETKSKDKPEENKPDEDFSNIDKLLASEGIIAEEPPAEKIKSHADKENGAMKKIGAILTTEISFNKIRDRLRSGIENEEMPSAYYHEKIIPNDFHNKGLPASELNSEEATASQDSKLQSEESNNGNDPRKIIKVDEAINDIMNEFGLSGTHAEHRSKPSP